jgi:Flp pilus assembly protein TadB
MANRRRKPRTTGRVTPKTTPRGDSADNASRRRRIDADTPMQVGRRPSSPAFLLVVSLMWIAVGIIAIASLTAWWRFVPGIVFIGIGLLFLRGASATIVRRDRRQSD